MQFGLYFAGIRPRSWLVVLAMFICVFSLAIPQSEAAGLQSLEIITSSGVHVFTVELMRTDEQRARGLMFRKDLPEGHGMLFDFNPEQNVSMWMKNTLISLDMIFIQSNGRILRIAENTDIGSEKIIASGGPVRGVLEVIAGTAKKYGIKPGHRIAHPLFSTISAK